jgi:hypothetical protein
MSTIDNINTNIINKIQQLRNIIDIYKKYNLDEKDELSLQELDASLEEILNCYELGSIEILTRYYSKEISEEEKQEAYRKYMTFLSTESIQSRMKRIHIYCQKLQKYDIDSDDEPVLQEAFRSYDYGNIDTQYNDETNKYCSACGNDYNIESKTSELLCNKCGRTEKLWGMVFEDEQFFYQEGQRTKHGKYDPTKHCKFWVDRIQAKESAEISEEITNEIKSCIKRDKIWLERLTCGVIRKYLKEIGKTKLNEHVPLIRKIITGKEPAQLTDHELKLIYVYFSRVIQIYNKIKPSNKPNSPYHPFFIYKIIEQILNKPEDHDRKLDILSTIHLQSRNTLIENDLLWKEIIVFIPDFYYISTDSSC